jgi:hypothetical protein
MKKTISILALSLLVQVASIAQPGDSLIIGIWLAEYQGFDPQTQSNITVKRRLIFEHENKVYYDTLWGQPTGLEDIIFEMEIGNWEINAVEDSVVFTPTISKRMDIANPDSLVEYDHGVHKKELSSIFEYEWDFHDDNMNVDYIMYKEEFISVPATPSGNTAPVIYGEYVYNTGGATSNLGHDLEYSFNWGDGSSSNWSTSTSASHSWDTPGIKNITASARCSLHPDRTATSEILQIDVQDVAESISKPGTPSGETSPVVDVVYDYTTSGSTSDLGHAIEYSFDWGDGTSSEWSTSNSASHSWSSPGLKYVSVTARCQIHMNKLNTSDNLEVNVLESPTGIPQDYETNSPFSFKLLRDYQGTYSSTFIISYYIPEYTNVIVSVYNIRGQLVRSLINQPHNSGYYEVLWDGTDGNGKTVNSGVYLFTFKTNNYHGIQKSILIK